MWPAGQPPASLCSPLPANPCSSVSGSKIFTFPSPAFALSATRRRPLFAPPFPQTLVAPFRGAKSSHFRRRISTSQALGGSFSLLPPRREPFWLRFGEQNLHISSAGFRPLCRSAALSLCSPLPANPCSSVSGSKIFTFPSPASPSRPSGGALSLLPATRKPLQLRSGEQNLHIPAVGFRPPRRSAALSLCSPLAANPYGSVSGSKIFTFPSPAFALSATRWLYASKGATAYPRKTKVNPLRLYFFCASLKSGHFSPQNRLLGLFPCRMKFAKKFYSAILSIRKDALGALYFYAWRFAHLRRACAPLSPSAPLLKLCTL